MRKQRRRWPVALALLAAAAAAIAGYYLYTAGQNTLAQEVAEPPLQTATVRRGDLVISATGSGTIIPADEVSLGFASSGQVVQIPVEVGDRVGAGDVLARLDETSTAREVAQAELSLAQAELQLAELMEAPTAAEMAQAEANLASARATLESRLDPATDQDIVAARESLLSAQEKLADLLAGPAAEDVTAAQVDLKVAEIALQQAQTDYDKVSWRPDVGVTSQAAALQEATLALEKARASYEAQTAGATAADIAAARASVAQAQSQLDTLREGSAAQEIAAAQASVEQAEAQLAELQEGASSLELESARLNVQQAEHSLAAARDQLQETELRAPFPGTIMTLDATVGERVGSSPIITLADLDQPLIEVYVDETDLDKVGLDYEAEVTFDALPDTVFTGHIIQVDPQLTTSNGVTAVRALVQLDASSFARPQSLPVGLSASVEVIGGRASQALLVPVEAVREIAPGQYAVFVLRDGKPTLTMVEVGLMDYTYAEILSGLNQGDVVTTGIVTTS
jgi:multidrug efflux pump subunit AcrA (membrane-fusion protein)